MRNSLREKVLLKASLYHIVAFVNNECLGKGNYVVVRAKPVTSCQNHNFAKIADIKGASADQTIMVGGDGYGTALIPSLENNVYYKFNVMLIVATTVINL
jgi:hypothetical protein